MITEKQWYQGFQNYGNGIIYISPRCSSPLTLSDNRVPRAVLVLVKKRGKRKGLEKGTNQKSYFLA